MIYKNVQQTEHRDGVKVSEQAPSRNCVLKVGNSSTMRYYNTIIFERTKFALENHFIISDFSLIPYKVFLRIISCSQ